MKRHLTILLLSVTTLWLLAISASAQARRFCIAKDGKAATIVVDDSEWQSVARAATDLADDVSKVTGTKPLLSRKGMDGMLLVGTIGRSRLVDRLVKQGKLDVRRSGASGSRT